MQAFEVYSIDYLLKPVSAERLAKTLDKIKKRRAEKNSNAADLRKAVEQAAAFAANQQIEPRLPSRVGRRVQLVEIARVTHFFAEDKLTFAATDDNKLFPVDFSINDLEKRLEHQNFVRIHRAALINANFIREVHGWFSGRVLVRLKDNKKTELAVARDRVRILKDFLGM